jgi:hypothetical protein
MVETGHANVGLDMAMEASRVTNTGIKSSTSAKTAFTPPVWSSIGGSERAVRRMAVIFGGTQQVRRPSAGSEMEEGSLSKNLSRLFMPNASIAWSQVTSIWLEIP